jgi:hypothetical protein
MTMLVYAHHNGTAYVAESEPMLRDHIDAGPLFAKIETLDSIGDLDATDVQTVGTVEFERRICPECNHKFTLHHGPKCLRCGI